MSVIFIRLRYCFGIDRFCLFFSRVSFRSEPFLQSVHCHFCLRTSAVIVPNSLCQQNVEKFLTLTNTCSCLIQLGASSLRSSTLTWKDVCARRWSEWITGLNSFYVSLWAIFFKICIITVIAHIKAVTFTTCIDKVTIYHCSKFHLPITNPSLDNTIKTEREVHPTTGHEVPEG